MPPRISTTPKEVKVKRNTIDAAEAMAGRRRGRVTSTNARHGEAPRVRAASSTPRVERGPRPTDGADHDGVVEEHVGDEDRPDGAGEVDAAHTVGAEHTEQGDADDDGREHERHEKCRPEEPFADEPVAGEQGRSRQTGDDAQHGGQRRLPQREPRHPTNDRVGDDVADGGQVPHPVGAQAADDDGRDRPHEEHAEEGQRRHRQPHPPPRPVRRGGHRDRVTGRGPTTAAPNASRLAPTCS